MEDVDKESNNINESSVPTSNHILPKSVNSSLSGNTQTSPRSNSVYPENNLLLPPTQKFYRSVSLVSATDFDIDAFRASRRKSDVRAPQFIRQNSTSSSTIRRQGLLRKFETTAPLGDSILVQVDEEEESVPGEPFKAARKDSLTNPTSIGGLTLIEQSGGQEIDKEIQKKIAHHSPNVATETKTQTDGDGYNSWSHDSRDKALNRGGVVRRTIQHFSHHLYIALATPAIIRIPHLAHKYASQNGSGFMFAYTLTVLFMAVPICVLEMTMGQYSSLGPINLFKCALPLLKGVGFGMVASCSLLMLLSSTWLSWSTFYLFKSMSSQIPWAACPSNFTNGCREGELVVGDEERIIKGEFIASDYFFQMNVTKVLEMEEGYPLRLNYTMVGIQLLIWLLLLFLVSRHASWQDRWISWIISIVTLILFIFLMFAGVSLSNSGRGLREAFQVNFSGIAYELKDPTLWMDTFGQAVWSLGPALGVFIARSSYNSFEHKIIRDITISVVMNFFIQILLMLMIFSYDGHLLTPTIYKDPGYFFVMSSYAVSLSANSHILSISFYFCVCICLLSHTIFLADTVSTSLTDILPIAWREGLRRICIDVLVCSFGFIASLIFVTKEGIYYMTALDGFLPWICGGVFGVLEILAFTYIYKVHNVDVHYKKMMGSKSSFKQSWKYFTPAIIVSFLLWAAIAGIQDPISWDHLFTGREDSYFQFGIIVAVVPLIIAVLVFIHQVIQNYKNLKSLLKPSVDWGSALKRHKDLFIKRCRSRRIARPGLVVYTPEGPVLPSNPSTYIPYGYTRIPKTPHDYLLQERSADVSHEYKQSLANLLKNLFTHQKKKKLFHSIAIPKSPTVASTVLSDEGTILRDRRLELRDYSRQSSRQPPEIEITETSQSTTSINEQIMQEEETTIVKKEN